MQPQFFLLKLRSGHSPLPDVGRVCFTLTVATVSLLTQLQELIYAVAFELFRLSPIHDPKQRSHALQPYFLIASTPPGGWRRLLRAYEPRQHKRSHEL